MQRTCCCQARRVNFVILVAGLLAPCFLAPETAYAYIDPNTGGYAFQLLFPLLSAVGGVFLFFRRQALSMCRKIAGLFRTHKD
jgi:hypothetical protein